MSANLKLLILSAFIILLVQSSLADTSDEENEFSFDRIKRHGPKFDFEWWHIIFLPIVIIVGPFIWLYQTLFG